VLEELGQILFLFVGLGGGGIGGHARPQCAVDRRGWQFERVLGHVLVVAGRHVSAHRRGRRQRRQGVVGDVSGGLGGWCGLWLVQLLHIAP
jgi:hypothetical protein